MKTKYKAKIIASKPQPGQDGIEGYIGKCFIINSIDVETQQISVNLEVEGESVIQPGEYELIVD